MEKNYSHKHFVENDYDLEIFLCFYKKGDLKKPYCDIYIDGELKDEVNCNTLSLIGACNESILEKKALDLVEKELSSSKS